MVFQLAGLFVLKMMLLSDTESSTRELLFFKPSEGFPKSKEKKLPHQFDIAHWEKTLFPAIAMQIHQAA